MIITDRFVVLNNPKTGSSFVRAVLARVYANSGQTGSSPVSLLRRFFHLAPRYQELLLPNIKVRDPRPPDQHGTYRQIPRAHRSKDVISVVRDPFDRLLSSYRYRWWARYPGVPMDVVNLRFPSFPDLTMEELLSLEDLDIRHRAPSIPADMEVGMQTVQFIQMFFRDPESTFSNLDERYLDSDRFLADLPPIRFLRTESLNEELHALLLEYGHSPESVEFVLEHDRVNVTSSPGNDFGWTAPLVQRILHRERLLFRILRHLGFEYTAPDFEAAPRQGARAAEER